MYWLLELIEDRDRCSHYLYLAVLIVIMVVRLLHDVNRGPVGKRDANDTMLRVWR